MAHTPYVPRTSGYTRNAPDLPIARIFAVLMLAIPLVAAFFLLRPAAPTEESSIAKQIASFNPKTLMGEDAHAFLPPPVAAIPAEQGSGPPAPSANDQATAREQVKVANTGGVGAILRAEPPRGPQVAGLRDGQVLQVLERRQVADDEWLKVKTPQGAEGWIYGRLVGPA